ncbi:MAG: hypothetical protein V4697_02910 [Patescibacteria group bacterium]
MKNKGFIALTLVIFVSSITLAFVAVQSIETAHFFDFTVQKKYRLMSGYFADNCVDQAVLELAHDYFFNPDVPQVVPDFHCVIDSVLPEGDLRMISVYGEYKGVKVYRKAVARLGKTSVDLLSVE